MYIDYNDLAYYAMLITQLLPSDYTTKVSLIITYLKKRVIRMLRLSSFGASLHACS